jgi:hypothetical protein
MRKVRVSQNGVVAVFFLVLPLAAQCSEYQSAKGFHLDYPSDWVVATKEQQGTVGDAAGKLVGSIDFDRIDVIIYNPQSDPIQNINIIVAPESMPSGNEGVSEVESAMRQQLASANIAAESLECGTTHIGSNDAISCAWTALIDSHEMHQRQFLIAGKVRSFVITCSSGVGNYITAEPAFTQVLSSFVVDHEPGLGPEEWWSGLSPVVRDVVIGAGIGAAYGLLSSLFKSAKK